MTRKRITPYQRIQNDAIEFADSVMRPQVTAFNITTISNTSPNFWFEVRGKIKAADICGFYTRIRVDDKDQLVWEFVKKPRSRGWLF